jgi:predicted nucleic acid-binding protein
VTRVTLDTNELISAFSFRGKALALIHRAIHGEIEIAISSSLLP